MRRQPGSAALNSAPPNVLAGFEGLLCDGEGKRKRERIVDTERKEEKGKVGKGMGGAGLKRESHALQFCQLESSKYSTSSILSPIRIIYRPKPSLCKGRKTDKIKFCTIRTVLRITFI